MRGLSPRRQDARDGRIDRSVRLWDVASGREIKSFLGHSEPVIDLAFSPDGGALISGSDDGTARLWDVETGRMLHVLEVKQHGCLERGIRPRRPAPSRPAETTGTRGCGMRRAALRSRPSRFRLAANRSSASPLIPTGGQLAATDGNSLTVWDIATGREMFSPQGTRRRDRGLQPGRSSHRFRRGMPRADLPSAAMAADRRCGGGTTVGLWDIVTGQEVAALAGRSQRHHLRGRYGGREDLGRDADDARDQS